MLSFPLAGSRPVAMRIHHSIVKIGTAAIPASVPSSFSTARKAGGLPPVKLPEKPANSSTKICENPSKTHHRQPSSTLKFFFGHPPLLRRPPNHPGHGNSAGASELRGASWTAAGSETPHRFRSDSSPQNIYCHFVNPAALQMSQIFFNVFIDFCARLFIMRWSELH
jgi:hypothetical protein